jgi:hypothetical protein
VFDLLLNVQVILNILDRAVIGQGLNQPDRLVFHKAHEFPLSLKNPLTVLLEGRLSGGSMKITIKPESLAFQQVDLFYYPGKKVSHP